MANQPSLPEALWRAYELNLTELMSGAKELKEEIRHEMIDLAIILVDENVPHTQIAEKRKILDEKHTDLESIITEINLAIMVKTYVEAKSISSFLLPDEDDPDVLFHILDSSLKVQSMGTSCSELKNRIMQQLGNN